jgi:enoyl-CoA hydratase/carnithine racemase
MLQTTLQTLPKGKIAHLTITRPKKLNALNTPLLQQFLPTFKSLVSHNDLLAVTLTGSGKSFIGGADLLEMSSLDSPTARAFITNVHRACDALRTCPVPVIAKINGFALGAGLEIAAAADLRVAAKRAVFGMPEVCLYFYYFFFFSICSLLESCLLRCLRCLVDVVLTRQVRLGIPSVVEAALLPGLIGWGRTRQLLLLGGSISAQEALDWGLVGKVVEDEDLDGAVEGWIGDLVKNGPVAVRRQKALMARWEGLSLRDGIEAGIEAFGECFEGNGHEPGRMMGEFWREKEVRKERGSGSKVHL